MTPAANPEPYKNHRFPPEIISHAVWLYFRFTLSYRDVEEWHLDEVFLTIHGERHYLWRKLTKPSGSIGDQGCRTKIKSPPS